MGWYNGAGAERVLGPVGGIPVVTQPPCTVTEPATSLLECRWQSPYVVQTTAGWRSGVYLAKLTTETGGSRDSYVLFVVRNDASTSRLLVQVPVNTYQAYNNWGGKSLYGYNSSGGQPAYKVSLNRPYAPGSQVGAASGVGAGEFLTNFAPASETSPAAWDYNMVRFLEASGYDVTYTTDYDVGIRPATLRQHKGFVILGHDEYWSMEQRDAIQAARDNGVNIGVFGANVGYWHVRFEPSAGVPGRTMVGYKHAWGLDPAAPSLDTRLFRDLGLPEYQLLGSMYGVDPVEGDIVIDDMPAWMTAPNAAGSLTIRSGDRLPGLLGYEIDWMRGPVDGATSLRRVGHSPAPGYSNVFGDMTVYTIGANATVVFSTGSMMWSWGLDDYNANLRGVRSSVAARQITRNVLDVLGETAQPTP
jgi:hypothetical protein